MLESAIKVECRKLSIGRRSGGNSFNFTGGKLVIIKDGGGRLVIMKFMGGIFVISEILGGRLDICRYFILCSMHQKNDTR
jgi:hypothetical protein